MDEKGLDSAEIEKTVSEMVRTCLDKELLRHNSHIADPFNSTEVTKAVQNQDVILSNYQEFDPLWKC